MSTPDCRIVDFEPSGVQTRFYCSCGWFGPDWHGHSGTERPAEPKRGISKDQLRRAIYGEQRRCPR